MEKHKIWIQTASILLLALASGFVVFAYSDFKLGLDIQGGTHLVYEGQLEEIPAGDREDAMASVREVIERRVNAFGVSEPLVAVAGDERLIVELPGVSDIEEAVRQIGLTPFLEFRAVNLEYVDPENPADINFAEKFLPTGLSGKHLKKSDIVFNPNTNTPEISLQFNDEGKKLFAEITAANIGRPLAIFLDGVPISAPVVQQQITAGQAVITGNFTIDAAKELAQRLNAGALPVPIKLIQQQNVGPALGKASLQKSVAAGILGLVAVALFMIIYYRLSGLVAVVALFIYLLLSLAIFKILSVTLTIAGIAGFILSVGMAVDANILVFERTREERRAGRDRKKALEDGFNRAWNAIRDSNVSSLITVLILGYFGTSLIRGFAITLGIGIVVSMFTALTVSRTFLRLIEEQKDVYPVRES